jgi:hypothetical protein
VQVNFSTIDEMLSSGLKVVCYKKLVIQVELQQPSGNHHKSDNLQPMWQLLNSKLSVLNKFYNKSDNLQPMRQLLSSKLSVLNKFYIRRKQEKKKLFHRKDCGFGLAALGRYFTLPQEETSSVFYRSAVTSHSSIFVIACVSLCVDLI